MSIGPESQGQAERESRRHVLSNSLASSYEGDKNLKVGFSEWWRSSRDLADDKYAVDGQELPPSEEMRAQ